MNDRIVYDDSGGTGPALLCLPGWCVSRHFFEPLSRCLTGQYRVVALDWRGENLVDEALSVIEAASLDTFVPVAQAHGAWVAIELRRRLGSRVPAMVALSWLVLDPPPPFFGVLEALQDPARWETARDQLFATWTADAPADIEERVRTEMGSFGFDMWSRGARAIANEYARHGNPLRALTEIRLPCLHVFSQPPAPEFLAAQESFAREHRWFEVRRLEGHSHFPALEAPGVTAAEIMRFMNLHAPM